MPEHTGRREFLRAGIVTLTASVAGCAGETGEETDSANTTSDAKTTVGEETDSANTTSDAKTTVVRPIGQPVTQNGLKMNVTDFKIEESTNLAVESAVYGLAKVRVEAVSENIDYFPDIERIQLLYNGFPANQYTPSADFQGYESYAAAGGGTVVTGWTWFGLPADIDKSDISIDIESGLSADDPTYRWAVDPDSVPTPPAASDQTYSVGQSVSFKNLKMSVNDFKTATSVTRADGQQESAGMDQTFGLVNVQLENVSDKTMLRPGDWGIELFYNGDAASPGYIDSNFTINGDKHVPYPTYQQDINQPKQNLKFLPPGMTVEGWLGFDLLQDFSRSKVAIDITRWDMPGNNITFRWKLDS